MNITNLQGRSTLTRSLERPDPIPTHAIFALATDVADLPSLPAELTTTPLV